MPSPLPVISAPSLTGTRLRERRLALGLKQGELALRAAISPSYLNLIEHNRRNVTADVLERLAQALGLEVAALSDRAPDRLTEDLRAAAAAQPTAGAELDRIEDFVARLPGWAALIAEQHGRGARLERAVTELNDRLGHDPHLSAALHELLSALSGVRATAAILAETDDLSADWQQRFHQNLHQDSERLAQGAERLVSYLDHSDAAPALGAVSPQDEVEGWLAARGWHLPEAEDGESLTSQVAELGSAAARSLAESHIARAREDARLLPLGAFTAALSRFGGDPALLAAHFGTDVLPVMRRMALLPGAVEGLVICDASGTILFRKPADGFALPRFGAACPIWPLFHALGRPGLPVTATVATPTDELFQTLAFCQTSQPFGFAGPELRHAAMLIRPLPTVLHAAQLTVPSLALPVGSTCRICARDICPGRREPSILAGH